MQLTVDLSKVHPEVRQRIIQNCEREDLAQQAVAWAEQARMAQFYRDAMIPGAVKPGVGPLQSIMHVALKNLLAAHYGHETVWQDPDFMKFILKKHEEFRVPEVRTKISAGWTPGMEPLRGGHRGEGSPSAPSGAATFPPGEGGHCVAATKADRNVRAPGVGVAAAGDGRTPKGRATTADVLPRGTIIRARR